MIRWADKLLLRLRALFRHESVEQELDAELRFHFEQQIGDSTRFLRFRGGGIKT